MKYLRLKAMLFLRKSGPWIKKTPLRRVVFSHQSLKIIRLVFGSGDRVLVRTDGGKMYVRSSEHNAMAYASGKHEPAMTKLFGKSVKKGDVVVDVGANIGYYTLIAAMSVGRNGKVYAFEPEPENGKLLMTNVEMNGYKNVEIIRSAVSDRNGEVRLFLDPDPTSAGTHSIHPTKGIGHISLRIKCVKLDDLFKKGSIDVVKIDTEGSEIEVLNGMKNVIRKSKGLKIFIELNFANLKRAGFSGKELIKKLRSLGFTVYVIDESKGGVTPMTEELFKKHESVWEGANLYCERK